MYQYYSIFVQNADRIRRDSIINDRVSKIESEPSAVKVNSESKIEIVKPQLLPEEPIKEVAQPVSISEEPVVEISKSETLPDEPIDKVSSPELITKNADSQIEQNNIEDDFGIRAEALYDYQAGSIN